MNRVPFCVAIASIGLSIAAAHSQSLTFSTLAGNAGSGSADGTGSNARFSNPSSVAVDSAGNAYVADTANHTIRRISPAGVVTTLAGAAGFSGSADGTGSAAQFSQPQGIATDTTGNVFVADTGNHTIRKVTQAGVVTTVAGLAGSAGSSDGTGSAARFYQPEGLAVDGAGNIYVADTWNHTIRKVTSGAVVTTLAGTAGTFGSANGTGAAAQFYQPQSVAVDSLGNVYVADTGNHAIRKVTAGGAVTTLAGLAGTYGSADGQGSAALFYGPAAIASDSLNNLYVADYFNQTVRKITPVGAVTTLAGLAGSFGFADGTGGAARFWGPTGIAARGTNSVTVYVVDAGNNTIRTLSGSGANWTSSTLACSASIGSADGSGGLARFYWPRGAGVDSGGNVLVADTQNGTIRKVSPNGTVSTLAGTAGSFGTADGTGASARFFGPQGIAVNSAGTAYVADTANHTIRKVTAGGVTSTFAGSPGVAGIDNGAGSAAKFNQPQGIAVDAAGNVYVADTRNHTVRKITSAGVVSTLAGVPANPGCIDGNGVNEGTNTARFYYPSAVAADAAGNVYVADTFNHTIREVTQAGVVSTLAGLPGVWGSADGTNSAARFYLPSGIAVDSSNAVYVLDSGNHTIRKLSPSGANWVVTTLGGAAGTSGSSDGAPASARFNYPAGLAVDITGFLYVADTANSTIRQGAAIVNTAPYIIAQPQGQTVNPGSDVTFSVAALGALPLSYQWRLNQAPIPFATGRSYTRPNAQTSDAGSYSVVVTNQLGGVTSADAVLFLTTPPSIVTQPASQTVLVGQAVTFSVAVSGSPTLTYQWQRNGSGIPGATGTSYTLGSAQRDDEASYSVFVTNDVGSALSADALLTFVPLDAWGDNSSGQLGFSTAAHDVIAIAAGAWHSLALRADGSVVAWGDDSNGQCDVPATLPPVLAIAGGGYHSLALRADGTVAAWGAGGSGQTNVPAGLSSVMVVAAGDWHSVALRRNGTVVVWGDDIYGQTNVPVGLANVVAIAAGGNHTLALRADGTVVAWGENTDSQGNYVGQSVVPQGLANVAAIAAGQYHSLAVRSDGTVVAWGANSDDQASVPEGLSGVVAVAGGGAHSLALKSDGTMVAWGANWNGQCAIPDDVSDVIGLAAGRYHSLTLRAGTPPVARLVSPLRQPNRFSTLVQTVNRQSYTLEYKAVLAAGNWTPIITNSGNGTVRQFSDPAATTAPRFYRMRQW